MPSGAPVSDGAGGWLFPLAAGGSAGARAGVPARLNSRDTPAYGVSFWISNNNK